MNGVVRSHTDWAAQAGQEFGHLDVQVNNAGMLREATLGETTLEVRNEVIAENLTGAFLGCRKMPTALEKWEYAGDP